ncbi:Beta-1,3-galactosyl-O-glycosyl-glycoprotein beta-1,6-N-acetylglucosaminyltransferase [Bulinus truncatus]|nr:Beta-1,3-galactosyl-O-glycosyl-glycoprotein beta-1,6-N-acetylglucosaminyltransferase [Bulinus truncatus]
MYQLKPASLPLSVYANAPQDCDGFIRSRGYITHSLPEEEDFPLAYRLVNFPLAYRLVNFPLAYRLVDFPLAYRLVDFPLAYRLVDFPLAYRLVDFPLAYRLVDFPVVYLLVDFPVVYLLVDFPVIYLLVDFPVVYLLVNFPVAYRLVNFPVAYRLVDFPVAYRLVYFPVAYRLVDFPLAYRLVNFPLAYSIMMYRDASQAERLLRAIYRPSNYYCIHVDAKADKDVQEAMTGISRCLPNVFLASKQNVVNWAQFNSLEPWIYCMRDLWKFSWKYFINLTGQEFPLKTNLQIIKILKALNGSNVVDTTTYEHYSRRWYENLPPPNNIQPYKGLVFVLVSRGFVDYILHNPVAQKLLDWVSHTDFPDESYFSTLNHNPHLAVPGSYKGHPETNADSKPYIARFVNWGVGWIDSQGRYPFYWPCGGKRVRRVCIFGVKDLELLVNRRELFANKFILDFEPLALDCLEEWHFNMTLAEYAGKLTIDTSWYQNLDIVRNKVL